MTKYSSKNSVATESIEQQISEQYNIAYRDITVLCGENLRENTISAFHKAIELQAEPMFSRTLMINTSVRQHWALKEGRRVNAGEIGDDFNHSSITVIGMPCGDICNRISEIQQAIEQYGIRLLIINSWEFAANGPRYREKLIFQLRELIDARELTVLVYAQNTASCEDVGINTRGKLGRLSAIAGMIAMAETEKMREEKRMRLEARERENRIQPLESEAPTYNYSEDSERVYVDSSGRIPAMKPAPIERRELAFVH